MQRYLSRFVRNMVCCAVVVVLVVVVSLVPGFALEGRVVGAGQVGMGFGDIGIAVGGWIAEVWE